jgi:hypothetical protein
MLFCLLLALLLSLSGCGGAKEAPAPDDTPDAPEEYTLERPEEIDENRARRAAEEAKEAMLQQRSQQEYLQAQADLSRALSRLKAASLRNKTI